MLLSDEKERTCVTFCTLAASYGTLLLKGNFGPLFNMYKVLLPQRMGMRARMCVCVCVCVRIKNENWIAVSLKNQTTHQSVARHFLRLLVVEAL